MTMRTIGLALSLIIGAASAAAAPQTDHWTVAGLKAPGEIIVDHWGIPHICAASERDAFFLQGYNAARDRLWQVDLWRKRGLGLLSASLGPAYIAQAGASVRMVIDVGAWDNSVVINTPGQPGDPADPHYGDLFPLWAAGAYAPLLYSRAAVDQHAERVIDVTPGE